MRHTGKKTIWLCAALLLLAAASPGCAGRRANNPPAPTAPVEQPDPIAKRVEAMTLEEKLGQMIIAGVDGKDVNGETRKLIADDRVGGVILYKDNIESVEQTSRMLNGLKAANKESKDGRPPLLIGVDQEGGKVSRLPAELEAIPSSRDIAKSGDSKRAESIGEALGAELRAFGFNVNFAPVLDIDSNPNNPVIGSRSFGSTASVVSSFGLREMAGLKSKGVIPVVKHFPGHGDTAVDSHLELPVVNKSIDQLRKLELAPFADAVRSGADAVMIAHILLPKIDPDAPSSMSSKVITGLLREELGFQGVVITDDMTMGAILKHYDIGKAAVQSVKAGTDIVLVAHEYAQARKVLDALKQAAASGEIPAGAIDKSVTRILKLKERYKLADDPAAPVDVKSLNAVIRKAVGK